MIAVVTILLAFPLGLLLSSRLAANLTYAVVYLWCFVFQTLYLLLPSLGADGAAGTAPFDPEVFPLDYGLVTLTVLVAGFALVAAGHWVRTRRQHSRRRAAAAQVA